MSRLVLFNSLKYHHHYASVGFLFIANLNIKYDTASFKGLTLFSAYRLIPWLPLVFSHDSLIYSKIISSLVNNDFKTNCHHWILTPQYGKLVQFFFVFYFSPLHIDQLSNTLNIKCLSDRIYLQWHNLWVKYGAYVIIILPGSFLKVLVCRRACLDLDIGSSKFLFYTSEYKTSFLFNRMFNKFRITLCGQNMMACPQLKPM